MTSGGRTIPVDAEPIQRFNAWLHKDGEQQTLWPAYLESSNEFFVTHFDHALPLDDRALSALKHSALALNVYTWLAQRLQRVHSGKHQFVRWAGVEDQFGQGYVRIRDFRKRFL